MKRHKQLQPSIILIDMSKRCSIYFLLKSYHFIVQQYISTITNKSTYILKSIQQYNANIDFLKKCFFIPTKIRYAEIFRTGIRGGMPVFYEVERV